MAEKTQANSDKTDSATQGNRRKLMAAIGGGVLGMQAVPGSWRKPAVASVMLPAHAQSSFCRGSLANCPEGYYDTGTLFVGGASRTFTASSVTNKFPGVSYVAAYLTGTGSYSNILPNDFDCGDCGSPSKYFGKYASFSGTTVRYVSFGEDRCDDQVINAYTAVFNASQTGSSGGDKFFTGTDAAFGYVCNYLGDT